MCQYETQGSEEVLLLGEAGAPSCDREGGEHVGSSSDRSVGRSPSVHVLQGMYTWI